MPQLPQFVARIHGHLDANLTKAHARYLESRFITLAQQAKRSIA